MSETRPKILVVEDDADIGEIITLQLQAQGLEVHLAENGNEARERINSNEFFHLYILDWMIPGPSGIELCRLIREREKILGQGPIPILMVTAKASPQFIVSGLDAGADDYLTKPFPMEILLARVRAQLRRGLLSPPSAPDAPQSSPHPSHREHDHILQHGPISLNERKFEVTCNDQVVQLTLSEFKILKGLMSHPGHVFTRKQLIERIAGTGIHVGGRTIDTQLVGLRKKLGECGQLIETIRGIGYRFKENI